MIDIKPYKICVSQNGIVLLMVLTLVKSYSLFQVQIEFIKEISANSHFENFSTQIRLQHLKQTLQALY